MLNSKLDKSKVYIYDDEEEELEAYNEILQLQAKWDNPTHNNAALECDRTIDSAMAKTLGVHRPIGHKLPVNTSYVEPPTMQPTAPSSHTVAVNHNYFYKNSELANNLLQSDQHTDNMHGDIHNNIRKPTPVQDLYGYIPGGTIIEHTNPKLLAATIRKKLQQQQTDIAKHLGNLRGTVSQLN